MTNLNRALRAEILKLNRTLALAMIFVAPLAVNFLAWLVIMRTDIKNPEPWKSLANNTLFVWGILMMPLFTTLETALISGLDHGASAWKHLYALPIPRWTIYAAKQIITMVLIGASMCVMCIGIWLTGTVTHTLGLKPNLDFGAPFPWSTVLTATLIGFLASWLIISIHVWVSMRWSSFTISLGVGIVAVVGAFVAVNSDQWRPLYPWSLSAETFFQVLQQNSIATTSILIGLIGGIVVALIGMWHISQRDVL